MRAQQSYSAVAALTEFEESAQLGAFDNMLASLAGNLTVIS